MPSTLRTAPGGFRFGDEDFERRFTRQGDGKSAPSIEEDITALVERVESWGAEVRLMTYPARNRLYAQANPVLRSAAERSGVPLIDLEHRFLELCPEEPCPELLFPDNHPTREGYRIVAQEIVDHLSAEWQLPTP